MYYDSYLCRWIYRGGFELEGRDFVNAFLEPGDIFVDVGANMGLYSLIAGHCVGNSGKVFAFEPYSITYKRLCENVSLNNFENVSTFKLALSDRNGIFPFQISTEGYDAWNSFAKPIEGRSFDVENVQCMRWDVFASEQDLIGRVALMKIDVEGWETRVLKGGSNVFSRKDAPVLCVEFADLAARSAESSCSELYKALSDYGYQMFVYDRLNRRIIPDPPREEYEYANLMASKNPADVHRRIGKSQHL